MSNVLRGPIFLIALKKSESPRPIPVWKRDGNETQGLGIKNEKRTRKLSWERKSPSVPTTPES